MDENQKISDIQVLRGLAISMVIICHMSFSTTILTSISGSLTNSFYAGVEMFFVISGFVVTKSLRRGQYRVVPFLIKRCFRLYPPILFFLFATALINSAIRLSGKPPYAVDAFSLPIAAFARQATAIMGGYLINQSASVGYMNGAMWSLSVEFQFYITAAAVALAMAALRFSMASKEAVGLAVAMGVLLTTITARILAGVSGIHVLPPWSSYMIGFRFDFMALGVVLAYAEPVLRTVVQKFRALALFVLIAPIVVLALCRNPLTAGLPGPDALDSIGMLFTAACYGAAVLFAAEGIFSGALPKSLLRSMYFVGERSYTVYLLHFPCMVVGWIIIVKVNAAWASNAWSYALAQPLATALVLIPLTECSYRWVELPCIALGRQVVRRMRPREEASAVQTGPAAAWPVVSEG